MQFEIRRIVLFTAELERLGRFYGEVLGLKPLPGGDDGWVEYQAGACKIALHRGKSSVGSRPPKIVFYAADVAAARAVLVNRGAVMGKVSSTKHFDLCDGKDPDGNPFQISSRK
jgi:catechol 2,3-dioxygenase-like lactoylglutathione lyase family enzyme